MRGLTLLCLLILQSIATAYETKPFVIAVGGGSASGKTFVAEKIVKELKDRGKNACLLSADNYYAPERQPAQFRQADGTPNYDHPSAVDMKKLAYHLMHLKSGFSVKVEEYTYGQVVAQPKFITTPPCEFIVLEGIYALYPELSEFVDFRVFVDVDADVRLQRRIVRDGQKRGISETAVREYFQAFVEPMHQTYIQPSVLYSDLTVKSPDDPAELEHVVSVVSEAAIHHRSSKYAVLKWAYDLALDQILTEDMKLPPELRQNFRVLSFDDLWPTQEEIGYSRLAEKSAEIDQLVRQTAVAFDLPSALAAFLRAEPVEDEDKNDLGFATDHHHLALALRGKGIEYFLVKEKPAHKKVEEWRFHLMKDGRRLGWNDLRNNPYRSLVSNLMKLHHIRKDRSVPQQEFLWAKYLAQKFSELGIEVTEEVLQDPAAKERVLLMASDLCHLPEARGLVGYIPKSCAELL